MYLAEHMSAFKAVTALAMLGMIALAWVVCRAIRGGRRVAKGCGASVFLVERMSAFKAAAALAWVI